LTWCFEEQASPQTEMVLDSLASGEGAAAPAIWPLEVANGLLVAEHHGRLTEAQVTAFLELLTQLPVSIEPVRLNELLAVAAVARFHELDVYDAGYLHLAARLGVKLATVDERLAAAAAKAGVALIA
jgi:predicted nucleic acid-binding protein